MAYYRINRDGRELTVQSNMPLAEMSEAYKDELIGECNQYGFLLGVTPELSATMQDILKRFKRDDIVTNRDIGLGKIDWASIDEVPKYFSGIQRDITLEGNVVETPIKETDMSDPTGLLFNNATNIQFTVEDGVTRLVYDAGGRRHSVIRKNGEYTSMSVPLESLEELSQVKGINFKDSRDKDLTTLIMTTLVSNFKLNEINDVARPYALSLITEKVDFAEWGRINWNRLLTQHSDLTVKEFIEVMCGRHEYVQGLRFDLNDLHTGYIQSLIQALEVYIASHAKTKVDINPHVVQITEESVEEVEDPTAPVETAKSLRKELLGKLNAIRNVTYRQIGIELFLTEDRIFALEKQYAIARSYVKKQLRNGLVDTDTNETIHLDVAQPGTFRVLRKNDEADWTLIAGVAFKDCNWVITQ